MLASTHTPVNATSPASWSSRTRSERNRREEKERVVADVKIDDGIIKVRDLEIQDPKIAAVLAEYPEARWAEIMRRAIKIGLGYLKGGAAS
jgi:hypothetical protein